VWRAMGKDRVTERQWKQLTATGVVSRDGKTWYPSESYAKGAKEVTSRNYTQGKTMEDYLPIKDFFRPNLLVLSGCKHILLEDVTFENSPAWCLHTLRCEHLTFEGVKVRNKENAQNGDGMDIESCAYVKVENCTLNCGDDGICIKSGKDEEGRKAGKPSMYIVIKNNVVYQAHGGFVIGSEMSGGAHDIFVSDCNFIGTANGLRFKTVRGRGGVVENIFIRNINMRDIIGDAITFDMYYFTQKPDLGQSGGKAPIPVADITTPQFRNFYIKNVICNGAARGILFRGLPEMPINNINVDSVTIIAKEGMEIVEAKNISLKNISFHCEKTSPLIHVENSSGISFDHLSSNQVSKRLFSIDGERTSDIRLIHSPQLDKNMNNQFNYGAKKTALIIGQ
ncbi:glycoside hydrolase family 28 protein, partial [Arachidicoccus sp.]|uniref:glycoside hydrolase family 28 protein n=1 Tax=Arachidicoccus sp. TaxID=1872624 RepID=UPI003D190A20